MLHQEKAARNQAFGVRSTMQNPRQGIHLRRIPLLLEVAILGMATSACLQGHQAISATPDAPDMSALSGPWLYTDGPNIRKLGAGTVQLSGIALPDLQVCERQQSPYIGGFRGILDKITDDGEGWHPSVIRLTVWPDGADVIGEPGWIPDPQDYYDNYLKPATDFCASKGLYFIIDWHWIGDYDSRYVASETMKFWSFIAPKYADNPYALFELFNEPIAPSDWDTWRIIAQGWIYAIRDMAPYNLLLVGNPRWSGDCSGAIKQPLSGGNIVYTCHIYPPIAWCEYDRRFGDTARIRPVMMTEWTFEHKDPSKPLPTTILGDDEVTDGICAFDPRYGPAPGVPSSNGYGEHFKTYLDAIPSIGWIYWCADNRWQAMFDESWNLRGGNYFSGEFAKQWLSEKKAFSPSVKAGPRS